MASLICAPTGLLLASPLAAPAGAQVSEGLLGGGTPAPAVTLDAGSPGTTLTSASPQFSGSAVPGDQGGLRGVISSVKVVISSADGHPGETFSITPVPPANGSSTWTFSGGVPNPLAYNGHYQATITATETDSGLLGNSTTGTETTSTTFAEDVPPVAPQGVRATPSGSGVSVAWAANPEPDLLGYDVLRSAAGAPQSLGTTTSTSYEDSTAAPGVSYTYEVIALRAGDATGQSLLSPATSASSVTLPTPLPSATTSPTVPTTTTTTSAASKALAKAASSDLAHSGIPKPASKTTSPSAKSSSAKSSSSTTNSSTSTTTVTTSATGSGLSSAGGETTGSFSLALPYPKSSAKAAAAPAQDPPTKSGSRARTLAEVALGMIFLVLGALAIRLVLRTSRKS